MGVGNCGSWSLVSALTSVASADEGLAGFFFFGTAGYEEHISGGRLDKQIRHVANSFRVLHATCVMCGLGLSPIFPLTGWVPIRHNYSFIRNPGRVSALASNGGEEGGGMKMGTVCSQTVTSSHPSFSVQNLPHHISHAYEGVLGVTL